MKWLLWAASVAFLLPSPLHSADNSTDTPSSTTSDTPSSASGLTKIALGEYTDFFIVDGKVRALGSNRANEAGFPATHGSAKIPAEIVPIKTEASFVDVACAGYQTLAVDDTGRAWVWGANNEGEMGDGTVGKDLHPPTRIETDVKGDPFDKVIGASAGFHFFVALKKDGSVWVWGRSGVGAPGYDSGGVIGNGDRTEQDVTKPSKVTFPDGVSIARISAGWTTVLALDTTGAVWSWGGGPRGTDELGTGSRDFATPTKLTTLPEGIKAIAAGSTWNYAVDAEGNLWGWGPMGGHLGLGKEGNYPVISKPVKLDFPDLNGRVKDVVISELTSHALRDDGTLWGWGSNPRGEVGNGEMKDWANENPPYAWSWKKYQNMVMKPVQVLDNVAAVYDSAQAAYVFAVKKDGSIWSWGRNKTGVLATTKDLPPSQEVAKFPDKWDVPKPTEVKPF